MTTEELFHQEFRLPADKNSAVLKNWEHIARQEITRWIENREYEEMITREVMKLEYMGPFTKFLYHFAFQCKGCGWGVMIDFNEHKQRVFLPDHYYKWMHKLLDEINAAS